MKHLLPIETIIVRKEPSIKHCTAFYQNIFRKTADLNIPGMTEFKLSKNCKLGLIPNDGIAKIIADKLPHPKEGNGIPRCELYFYVKNIQSEYDNTTKSGAKLISSTEDRDWGDQVCYFEDLDRHIIAFAKRIIDK
mgnify:CR=1 FL=1